MEPAERAPTAATRRMPPHLSSGVQRVPQGCEQSAASHSSLMAGAQQTPPSVSRGCASLYLLSWRDRGSRPQASLVSTPPSRHSPSWKLLVGGSELCSTCALCTWSWPCDANLTDADPLHMLLTAVRCREAIKTGRVGEAAGLEDCPSLWSAPVLMLAHFRELGPPGLLPLDPWADLLYLMLLSVPLVLLLLLPLLILLFFPFLLPLPPRL